MKPALLKLISTMLKKGMVEINCRNICVIIIWEGINEYS